MKAILIPFLLALWLVHAQQDPQVVSLVRQPHRWLAQEPPKRTRNSETLSLLGGISALGEFYIPIQVGTPPQTVNVQVDTGSSDLLLFGNGCTGACGTPASNPEYNYPGSSTAVIASCMTTAPLMCSCLTTPPNGCSFTNRYGDGSQVSGYIVQDAFRVGNLTTTAFIGNILTASSPRASFEPTGVSGIWGLAFAQLSSTQATPPFILMSQNAANNLPGVFSMCLGEGGASMIFGGNYPAGQFQYAPLSTASPLWWSIILNDIQVGTTSIGITTSTYNAANSPSIVDSGTTLVVTPTSVFTALKTTFTNLATTTTLVGLTGQAAGSTIFDNQCFTMNAQQIAAYPPVNVFIGGITGALSISPNKYLIPVMQNGVTYYCLGFAPSAGRTTGVILGDVFMENYQVVFDLTNNRVGFGSNAQCITAAGNQPVITTGAPAPANPFAPIGALGSIPLTTQNIIIIASVCGGFVVLCCILGICCLACRSRRPAYIVN